MVTIKREDDLFVSGHTACAGCGAAINLRTVMRAVGKDCIVVNATGCSEIFTSCYPLSAWKVPYIHVTFENAAAVATGVAKALEAQGNNHTQVVVIAGDGASYDIGVGLLSGMLERNDNILYFCYDNEAYENTGIQRSSATPYKAWTTTSEVGSVIRGKMEPKKDLLGIVRAHNIPYVASASVGYLPDLEMKVRKAMKIKGARFICSISTCVPGWKHEPALAVKLAKLAVDTGIWKLYEVENGKETINTQPPFVPVEEYFKLQGRFRHLTKDDTKEIQDIVNRSWGRA